MIRDKARAFGCIILYFTLSSEHQLTNLHDLQTSFHSIDFCRIPTISTGDQLYSDPSPYGECRYLLRVDNIIQSARFV